jgi:cobyrinic acid a,c-diamide synthase
MVGIFEAEAVMRRPGLVLGYREIETTRPCLLGKAGTTARGHEFHYSQLVPKSDLNYAWTLKNAQGRTVGQDGLTRGNVLGAYTHLHFGSQPEVAIALLESRP